MTKIILGLGNPGPAYKLQRHNLGQRASNALLGEDSWEVKERVFSWIKEMGSKDRKIVFAKNLTFMNESGKAARSLLKFYNVAPEQLLVIHDDADILFGRFKLSFGSRSAGHQGVESIIRSLKTKDFWRLRIGIQPELGRGRIRAEALILKRFSRQEEEKIPAILEGIVQAVAAWLEK